MKRTTLLIGLLIASGASSIAFADLKDDVAAAAKKLAEQSSYEWRTTVRSEGGGPQAGGGGSKGQFERDGYLWVSSTSQQGRFEFARKADKIAVFQDGNWMTSEQAAARAPGGRGRGRGGPGGGLNQRALDFKTPVAEIDELVGKTANFKQDGDTVTAELTSDAATELLNAGAPQSRAGRGRGFGRGDAQRGGRGRGGAAQRGDRGQRGGRGFQAPVTRDVEGGSRLRSKTACSLSTQCKSAPRANLAKTL
jgi:hypothetical protein